MQVGAVALEKRMRADRQENIEIARRAAAYAGFALAGEPDAGAVLDAGRNIHRQGPLARDESLGVAHAALTAAHRTGFRLGAGLGAGAGTGFAGDRGRNADLRILA